MGWSIKSIAKGASRLVKKAAKPLAVGAASFVGGPAAGVLVAKGFAAAEGVKKVAQAFKSAPVTGIIPQASRAAPVVPNGPSTIPPGYFVVSEAELNEMWRRARAG